MLDAIRWTADFLGRKFRDQFKKRNGLHDLAGLAIGLGLVSWLVRSLSHIDMIELTVNGTKHQVDVVPEMPLLNRPNQATGEYYRMLNEPLNRLSMKGTASVMRNATDGATKAVITELRPPGTFATWKAERVIGDHDSTRFACTSTRRKTQQILSLHDCLDRKTSEELKR